MKRKNSEDLYARATQKLPGGVNSPVRAFKGVGGTPLFIQSGRGGHVQDQDRNDYIDFVGSWGALILGHAHPRIVEAIQKAASQGTTFGAPTEIEVELAERISAAIPSMQMLRLVSSGTEATMSALRVARGFTKKRNIVKFQGCYHGHHDSLLTAAGSGVATFDLPDSAGIPESYTAHTITVPYNDFSAIENLSPEVLSDTAAVIIEPVAANMGLILPEPNFLKQLRDFTKRRGILLIFDEVITGFRCLYGGIQRFFQIEPDLTCLGKIVGGGMPLAAYGGRAEIMECVAPLGAVYQAGTLSGNPVAASAGVAALKLLKDESEYQLLEERTTTFLKPLADFLKEKDFPVSITRLGSMFTIFFRKNPPKNFQQAKECDTKSYAKLFWGLLNDGIYLTPSQFETNFVSLAHTNEDLGKAGQALRNFFSGLC
jgi:glutamate-1-semialdehyde 2,1-aminomutase